MTKPTTAVIIRNPVAGHAASRERQLDQSMDILRTHGWAVEIESTLHEGHGTELAVGAVSDGADIVVAAGGDGTINEVIQGLAHKKTALGVLPLGTVNVWSREAGYSSNVATAAKQLVAGRKVRLDLGRIGDRFFLLMAGVGLDAEVAGALGTARMRKQKLGVLPYLVRAAQVVPRYRGASVDIELDGESNTHDALMVLVSNTRLYGGVSRPIPGAVANDGMLDVRVFHGRTASHSVKHIARFLFERGGPADGGDVIRARKIVVNASPPLAVQVDGDPIGITPVEIAVERHALNAIVPETYNTSLISPDHE